MMKLNRLLLACLLLSGCQLTPNAPQTGPQSGQTQPAEPQAAEAAGKEDEPIHTHPQEPGPFGKQADATRPCTVGPWTIEAPEGQMTKTRAWVIYRHRIDALEAAEIPAALEETEQQYAEQPDDLNRLRLAYLLTRPGPTPQQLSRGREVLGEISNSSELAPLRDSLDREIALLIQLSQDQGRIDELQAQLEALTAQLEALKAIEEEMVENREDMEERGQP